VREIQPEFERYRGVRGATQMRICAIESAVYRNIDRVSGQSGCRRLRESKLVRCGADTVASNRRVSWTQLLIGRDFSGLTLTSGKP
jgi:hypothetical protein